MIKNYAVIDNGKVVNVVLAESALADNWVESAQAAIGDDYAEGVFTGPEAAVKIPEVVTMAQARKALVLAGIGTLAVDAAIQAIQDSTQRALADVDWNYSATVRRDSYLVESLGSSLGLTSLQIDQLFLTADRL